MPVSKPELELVERTGSSVRYLQHGYPDPLVRWHYHEELELHLIVATQGKAFVGDYIGPFAPGHLVLTGPMLPHNWLSNADSAYCPLRDMVVQFPKGLLYFEINACKTYKRYARCWNAPVSASSFSASTPTKSAKAWSKFATALAPLASACSSFYSTNSRTGTIIACSPANASRANTTNAPSSR